MPRCGVWSADLSITAIATSDDLAADIDTWDDLTEARKRNP